MLGCLILMCASCLVACWLSCMLVVVLLVDVCGIKLLLADDVAAVYRSRTCHLLGVPWQEANPHMVLLRATSMMLKAQVKRLGVVLSIRSILSGSMLQN